jgi:hypothetical protein
MTMILLVAAERLSSFLYSHNLVDVMVSEPLSPIPTERKEDELPA